jgi:hypothetical protein
MSKIRVALKAIIRWIIKERLPEVITFAVVGTVMYAAVFAYYINYIGNLTGNLDYNFEMAILSATLGGFVLIGGFLDKAPSTAKKDLVSSATGFLASAVFSTIFVFTVPLEAVIKPEQGGVFYLLTSVLLLSVIISVFGFTWGVSVLIPCLWKIGRKTKT